MSEDLLTLLSAGSINYDGVGGGIPTLTAQDVAAGIAAAKIDRRAYLLMLLKANSDENVWPDLMLKVNELTAERYYKESWRSPHNDNMGTAVFFEEFGRTAVEQFLGMRCKTCNGTGVYAGAKHKACNGTGIKAPSASAMARRVGVSEGAWRKTWAERHIQHVDRLTTEYETAVRRLAGCIFDRQVA